EVSRRGTDRTLYLFTYSFPFGPGETFLETEVGYLAAHYARVVIIPARLEGLRRDLPANVTVEAGFARMLLGSSGPGEIAGALLTSAMRRELVKRPSVLASPQHLRRLLGQILASRKAA